MTALILLACAPPALEDPHFNPEELPERAELVALQSARARLDSEPFDVDAGGMDWGRKTLDVLDWDSDSVRLTLSERGVMWAFWVDRDDLTSAVVADVWVPVGEQGAGVELPAGLRLEAAPDPHGWEISHDGGLLQIVAPYDAVDQVFADVGLRDQLHGGGGAYFKVLPGGLFLDDVDGAPFAENPLDHAQWVEPLEREADGQWVSWTAPFGVVEGWVADEDLEDMGNSAGGYSVGCCHCGGFGSFGVGLFMEPNLPAGSLLLDAPDGEVVGRTEWDMYVQLGEPVWGRTPVELTAPWGEMEVWVDLD